MRGGMRGRFLNADRSKPGGNRKLDQVKIYPSFFLKNSFHEIQDIVAQGHHATMAPPPLAEASPNYQGMPFYSVRGN